MSTLYRCLPEQMFSTPWFRRLSANAKLVIITLTAGPCATGCPGLTEADAYTLVSLVGLDVTEVQKALAELVKAGVADVDDDHRVVRLPWVPRMRTISSYKTLIGWFKVWKEIPDCPAKYDHIASLKEGTEPGEGMAEAWAKTFGAVKGMPSPTEGHGKGLGSPTDHADADADATKKEIAAGAAPSSNQVGEGEEAETDQKAKREPLPFRAQAVADAIAAASNGRFVASPVVRGVAINLEKLIKAGKITLDDAKAAGAWLGNGGDGWKGQLDSRNLGDLQTWIAHAKANTTGAKYQSGEAALRKIYGPTAIERIMAREGRRGHAAPSDGPDEVVNQSSELVTRNASDEL